MSAAFARRHRRANTVSPDGFDGQNRYEGQADRSELKKTTARADRRVRLGLVQKCM